LTLPAAIDHLARRLFANPRHVNRANDAQGLEVAAVAGTSGEVRYLAARIKRLILDGTSLADVVVAVRDLDDYSWLIDEVFSAANIPFACEAGVPLSRLAPFKALVNVLSLEVEDWPFRQLMSLLDSGLFRPNWQEYNSGHAVRDVSAELRGRELFEGRQRILDSLERAARNRSADQAPLDVVAQAPQPAADRAYKMLAKLSETTAELRRPHDLDGWSGVMAGLVRELGFALAPLDESSPVAGLRFGELLTSILFDAARAERIAGIAQVPLTLREFIAELTDLIERQRLDPWTREEGRVRVLSAEQVRNLDVPYLFLAGLSETSFPRYRNDDCLYSEGERQDLNEHGLSLGHRALRAQEELLMFYGVVTRARKQLVLTYPVVGDEGQPLSRSPYLAALVELFEQEALQSRLEEQLDPVPRPERVLSPADARVRGMCDALAGRPGLFRAACETQESARNCLAAVEMNVHRFHTTGFTNFEGLLDNPRNIEALRERFSEAHEFSATQLEAYARCPFQFLLSQVLKKEPPVAPGVETDFGRRGTLVHEVLADLHRVPLTGRETARDGGSLLRGEAIAQLFQKLLEEKLRGRPAASHVQQALERIEQRLLVEWGLAYGRQWDEYIARLPRGDSPPLPALFETAFGTPRAASEPAAQNLPPLVFGAGPEAVRVGGRIDRIDVGRLAGRTVYSVIDYKTGRRTTAKIDSPESGRKLQLVLYTLAVARLEIAGPGGRPFQMGYWHVKETGFAAEGQQKRARVGEPLPPMDDAVWQALVKTLEEVVPRLAAGIRGGRFAVYNADQDCTAGCPYNTVCRVAQIRALPEILGKITHTSQNG
jgi:ATP-dependent helicase/nuclease subunit B